MGIQYRPCQTTPIDSCVFDLGSPVPKQPNQFSLWESSFHNMLHISQAMVTRNEINEGPARFSAEKDLPPHSLAASNAAMTAVELATREGSIVPQVSRATSSSHSALSVSSPVHGAVEARQPDMLNHLLSRNYNPNLLATVAATGCLSPLIIAVACDPLNISAFNILVSHPLIDLSLRSPNYDVHPLHLASVRLSVSLLENVSVKLPLETAGSTALGFTLLHIVCLPLTTAELELTSPLIATSITRLRSLSTKYLPTDTSTTDLPSQTASARWIVYNTSCNVSAADVHGNTPLQYLAAYRVPNEELITWLRSRETRDDREEPMGLECKAMRLGPIWPSSNAPCSPGLTTATLKSIP